MVTPGKSGRVRIGCAGCVLQFDNLTTMPDPIKTPDDLVKEYIHLYRTQKMTGRTNTQIQKIG